MFTKVPPYFVNYIYGESVGQLEAVCEVDHIKKSSLTFHNGSADFGRFDYNTNPIRCREIIRGTTTGMDSSWPCLSPYLRFVTKGCLFLFRS